MEKITFEETSKELVKQLEKTLAKLAIAADSGIATGNLETKSQKLAAKLKASASLFGNLPLYKGINTDNKVYNWTITEKLPDDLFVRYAKLCKVCEDTFEVYCDEEKYFAEISEGLYCNIVELPDEEMPKFKVKIEGDTLMAIRTDLYEKLPESTKKLLEVGGNNEQ